jgi:lipoteichoic acid synthase
MPLKNVNVEEPQAPGFGVTIPQRIRSVAKNGANLVARACRILFLPELVILVTVLAAMVFKITLMQPAATSPIWFAVAQHDAGFFALVSLCYAAASALQKLRGNGSALHSGNRKWLAGAAWLLGKLLIASCLVLVVAYLADVLVYRFFVTRLYAGDIVTFSRETHAGFTLSRAALRGFFQHTPWKIAALAGWIFLFVRAYVLLLFRPASWYSKGIAATSCAFALLLVWIFPIAGRFYSFDDKPLYENVLERNRNYFVQSNFSDSFRAKVLASPEPATRIAGSDRRVNIVLLVVESLSAYHSHYFSGIEDWTPQLDDIARHETAMTNFYANGWTTIGGLISLFTGTFPVVPEHTAFNVYGSPRFPDFAGMTPALPLALQRMGYRTEFIGAGDLDFTGKDTWLKDVGFEKTVGGNDPRFATQTVRGPFNSVPDRMLYGVALDELSRMPKNQPYFAVVETFWTHRPFLDEHGNHLAGEEPAFREADAEIGRFYRSLAASHFLDHGLLIIVGDHRGPMPFRQVEFQRFGDSAVARIPAVLATHAFPLPHVIPQDFQQRDLLASIESLVSDDAYLHPEEGSFLSNPLHPPACILHSRGDDRDLVLVKCGSAEGIVRVAGDRTRFVKGDVPDEPTILETINRMRARPPK